MKPVGLALALPFAAILLGMWDSWRVLLDKLLTDETYQHGLLVPAVCGYAAWQLRDKLDPLRLRPSATGIAVLVLVVTVWMVASVAGVRVVEQFALVAAVPAIVFAVLGADVTRTLAFPLGYLFLMVPVGQALVPPLMEFTADITVAAVRASGIPVYREGLFFSLPSGDFEVAKACSGIRYLMASVATGALLAYYYFNSWRRRAAFMAFAVILPVLANGLRAYLIVIIAHASGMTIATGVDHLVYGWVFFGLVMAFMIWVGLRFRDADARDLPVPAVTNQAEGPDLGRGVWVSAVAAAVIIGSGATYAGTLDPASGRLEPVAESEVAFPASTSCWRRLDTDGTATWMPGYHGSAARSHAVFADASRSIEVFTFVYRSPAVDGEEMISYRNQILAQSEEQRDLPKVRRLDVGNSDVSAVAELLHKSGGDSDLLIWYWFEVGGTSTTSPYVVKAREALAVLGPGRVRQRLLVLSTKIDDDIEGARQALTSLVEELRPPAMAGVAALDRVDRCP